jgi:simple sugar transport system permease protein
MISYLAQMGLVFWDYFAMLSFGVFACYVLERAGVFNVAIESELVVSSTAFAFALSGTNSIIAAMASGVTAGFIVAALFSIFTLVLGFEEVASGLAINMVMLGLSISLALQLGGQRDIPLVGNLGTRAMGLRLALSVGLLLAACFIVGLLRHSRLRQWFHAVRYNRTSARYCDIPVGALLAGALVASGLLAGAGGCYLAVALAGFGPAHWKLGLGFVALGLVVAADGSLPRALFGAGVFSLLRLLAMPKPVAELPLPSEILEVAPYVGVLAWFCILAGRRNFIRPSPTTSL